MVFDGLKELMTDLNFNASSICTSWNEIKTSEHFCDYPMYDYFPVTNNGVLTSMVCRTRNKTKEEIKLADDFFLKKEASILDVIHKFKTNYKNRERLVEPGFLILGGKENPLGMLTFADLNREEVSALIWRIIMDLEISLKKTIGEITTECLKSALNPCKVSHIEDRYRKDKEKGLDLGLVNYLSLPDLKKILKKCGPHSMELNIKKCCLTEEVIDFRNRVSHHKIKMSLISSFEDIYKLHNSLKNLQSLHVNLSQIMAKNLSIKLDA